MKKLSKKQKLIVFIAILLVAVILAIVITTNIISNNNQIANQEEYLATTANAGSSLVASYIKKGITIGGITGTLETLDTSDATAYAEDIAWGKVAYARGERIVGTYLTLGMLKVGDYVAYTPDSAGPYTGLTQANTGSSTTTDDSFTQESLSWRVLNINDDGTVDLISATPTSQNIYLSGATGYNNGVYMLNDVAASLYSNKSLGATARSLTIEDIEAGMNESGLDYIHSDSNSQAAWGETYTYTGSRYYPNLYAHENGSGIDLATTADPNSAVKEDGINQSDSYYDSPTTETYSRANKALTITQTYYYRSMSSSYYKNSTFYNLIHGFSGYQWLASRCVVASNSSYAGFGLGYVYSSILSGSYLFTSSSNTRNDYDYLRPVVSLGSNIRLSSGDGSSSSPYQIAD